VAISFTGKNRIVTFLFSVLARVLKLGYRKLRLIDVDAIDPSGPSILVANHQGSYGPIALMLFLPFSAYPWVTHEIVDRKHVANYIEYDFVRKELFLAPPLSTWLARLIGWVCVGLMQSLQAIAVYRGSRRIKATIEESCRYLKEGRWLLVFPEIADESYNEFCDRFDTGFVAIARRYFEVHGRCVRFYPVAVDRTRELVRVAPAIRYQPGNGYRRERERIVSELQNTICDMMEV
jgi:1-acyl-sn-glycerol-3-phosphate acyltransferase